MAWKYLLNGKKGSLHYSFLVSPMVNVSTEMGNPHIGLKVTLHLLLVTGKDKCVNEQQNLEAWLGDRVCNMLVRNILNIFDICY